MERRHRDRSTSPRRRRSRSPRRHGHGRTERRSERSERHRGHRRSRSRSRSRSRDKGRPSCGGGDSASVGGGGGGSASVGGGGGGGSLVRLPGGRSAPVLSAADFCARAKEFRVWLARKTPPLLLFDLPKDEARVLFGIFCEAWNSAQLPHLLYANDSRALDDAIEQSGVPRTTHAWALRLSEGDRQQLSAVADAARAATARGGPEK